MASGIDAQVISEGERTFQFQDVLESLPVPSLEHTLSNYLDSVKPHVTDEEFREVESQCQKFASGEGKVLHEKLVAFARTKRNWLEKWWQDSYMDCRLPNPLMNMAGPGPYIHDIWKAKPGSMIPRTALMLYFIVQFWQLVRKEKIRPHKDGKGRPMCMSQFRKLFNTCNIPGVQSDRLMYHFKTESEGPCPSHVVVICNGHLFSMECVDEEGATLTAPELQVQLQKICNIAALLPDAPGVGFFTALERTEWAKVRCRLLACHPQNFHSLDCIEKAICVIGLDDYRPADIEELAWCAMFGDPKNKWFDKAMTFICYENGLFGSCCDHSPMDGMMLVFSTFYVHCKLVECNGVWKGRTGVRKFPEPKHLEIHLDAPLMQNLQDAKNFYEELRSRVELKVSLFTAYGKKYLKTQRIHPDTCMQLAFQLAYYRMYQKHAPTYETATTRRFYHGRTETVRSCTPEACQWCKGMESKTTTEQEKFQLFMRAVEKHNKCMEEATNLKGCDRHLYGLYNVAVEEGLPIPSIFMHPAFVKSGGGGNYILSTSCIGYTTVFGGVAPMCPHGYGIFYSIRDEKVTFVITAWTADEDTSSKAFSEAVHQALIDIRQLQETGKSSTAHL